MHSIPNPFRDIATLADAWSAAVDRYPDEVALVPPTSAPLTYREADRYINALARRLHGCGLQPGDPVHVMMPMTLEGWCLLWASSRLGLLTVLLDPRMTLSALNDRLALCPSRLLITTSDRAKEIESIGVEILTVDHVPDDRGAELPSRDRADAPSLLLWTSGTTGEPKAVLHAGIGPLHGGGCTVHHYGWAPGFRVATPGGMHTIGALRHILGAALAGATIVAWPTSQLHPRVVIQYLRERRVNHVHSNPAFYRWLTDPRAGEIGQRPPAIGLLSSAGAPLAEPLRARYGEIWDLPLWNHIGSTESGGFSMGDWSFPRLG